MWLLEDRTLLKGTHDICTVYTTTTGSNVIYSTRIVHLPWLTAADSSRREPSPPLCIHQYLPLSTSTVHYEWLNWRITPDFSSRHGLLHQLQDAVEEVGLSYRSYRACLLVFEHDDDRESWVKTQKQHVKLLSSNLDRAGKGVRHRLTRVAQWRAALVSATR